MRYLILMLLSVLSLSSMAQLEADTDVVKFLGTAGGGTSGGTLQAGYYKGFNTDFAELSGYLGPQLGVHLSSTVKEGKPTASVMMGVTGGAILNTGNKISFGVELNVSYLTIQKKSLAGQISAIVKSRKHIITLGVMYLESGKQVSIGIGRTLRL